MDNKIVLNQIVSSEIKDNNIDATVKPIIMCSIKPINRKQLYVNCANTAIRIYKNLNENIQYFNISGVLIPIKKNGV